MEWVRGDVLGHGSFGSVSLAATGKGCSGFPGLMAVKSCQDCCSATLRNEKEVLEQLGNCPQIVRCFGDECSVEKGEKLYNLFLEYACGGSLADLLKKNNGRLEESEVRRYTRSVLKGLRHIHAKGFVHCDVKLQNVLVFDNDVAKIADFGLAKKSGKVEQQSEEEEKRKFECRGTPLYMSPESVNDNEYESPADIWALGCSVLEMLTGKPAWNHKPGTNLFSLLIRIGVGEELPTIPGELSELGKDFLFKCLVKDSKQRWTADTLLNHPFVSSVDDVDGEIVTAKESDKETPKSPISPFSFPEWVSVQSYSPSLESGDSSTFGSLLSSRSGLMDRVQQLAVSDSPDWSDSEGWIVVR